MISDSGRSSSNIGNTFKTMSGTVAFDIFITINSANNLVEQVIPNDGYSNGANTLISSTTYSNTYPYMVCNTGYIRFSGSFPSFCAIPGSPCITSIQLQYDCTSLQYKASFCPGTTQCSSYTDHSILLSNVYITPSTTTQPTVQPTKSPTFQPTSPPTPIPTAQPTTTSEHYLLTVTIDDNGVDLLAFNGTIRIRKNTNFVTAIYPEGHDISTAYSPNTTLPIYGNTTLHNDQIFDLQRTGGQYVTTNGLAYTSSGGPFGASDDTIQYSFLYYTNNTATYIHVIDANTTYPVTSVTIKPILYRIYYTNNIDCNLLVYNSGILVLNLIFTIDNLNAIHDDYQSTNTIVAIYPDDAISYGNTILPRYSSLFRYVYICIMYCLFVVYSFRLQVYILILMSLCYA